MLLLTLGQTAQEIVVTLNEKKTLDSGYWLFVFKNLTTSAVVNKIYAMSEDDSAYQDRFNQFTINTNAVFSGQDVGQWRYDVYEQASASNTDTTGLNCVEKGLLRLDPASEDEMAEYDTPQTMKQYGG